VDSSLRWNDRAFYIELRFRNWTCQQGNLLRFGYRMNGEVSDAIWETLEAMEKAITKVLRPFWESAEHVFSLLGDNWLTNGVSEFLKLRESLI
jgi:hypothetical protein